MDRRTFLQSCVTTGLSLYGFSHGFPLLRLPVARAGEAFDLNPASPIQKVSGAFVSGVFNGDDISRPHDLLWNVENYVRGKGGRPTSFDFAKVAVVGGGMSGLLSAYALRDQSPILFEQAPAFGGNSKGEEYRGSAFSIGAAYIGVPEEGGEIEKLFAEIGIAKSYRRENPEEVEVSFSGLKKIWRGETDPARREAIAKVTAELSRIYREAYPEIPWTKDGDLTQEEFRALDNQTAKIWLEKKFPDLHPHVEEFFQIYCWSSFGGSLDELSAAQFLNFICAETEGVIAFPGGNAAIGVALHQSLMKKLPAENLKSYSMVLEVKNVADGVEILYEDNTGKIRLLKAKAVVMAAPKYVARYIVKGLDSDRDDTWKELLYRAYAVCNVLLKTKVSAPAFDVFSLEGKVPASPTFGSRTDRPWADFVFAGWADRGEGQSVLTLYKPYPFEGARSLVSSEVAHKRIQEEIEKEFPKTLASLGLPADSIEGIRVTRWGHSLPLAQPGMLTGSTFEFISAPHGRIAFANQDNYMSPAFESCFTAAQEAAKFVRSVD